MNAFYVSVPERERENTVVFYVSLIKNIPFPYRYLVGQRLVNYEKTTIAAAAAAAAAAKPAS